MLWYVPRLNKLPRDHTFALGDRGIGFGFRLAAERPLLSRRASNA